MLTNKFSLITTIISLLSLISFVSAIDSEIGAEFYNIDEYGCFYRVIFANVSDWTTEDWIDNLNHQDCRHNAQIQGLNEQISQLILNNSNNYEERISALENWKTTITTTLSSIWQAITGHTTRIEALENKTIVLPSENSSYLYFKYLTYSDRKNIVCGFAQDNHLVSLIDLKVNCTVTYKQYSYGERATCRCKEIK